MSVEVLSIIIRITILYILGITSQLALRKRMYVVWLFTLAVWLTIFRLTIWRAVTFYMGVFNKIGEPQAVGIKKFLESAWVTNISDAFILIGSFGLFVLVINHKFLNRKGRG